MTVSHIALVHEPAWQDARIWNSLPASLRPIHDVTCVPELPVGESDRVLEQSLLDSRAEWATDDEPYELVVATGEGSGVAVRLGVAKVASSVLLINPDPDRDLPGMRSDRRHALTVADDLVGPFYESVPRDHFSDSEIRDLVSTVTDEETSMLSPDHRALVREIVADKLSAWLPYFVSLRTMPPKVHEDRARWVDSLPEIAGRLHLATTHRGDGVVDALAEWSPGSTVHELSSSSLYPWLHHPEEVVDLIHAILGESGSDR